MLVSEPDPTVTASLPRSRPASEGEHRLAFQAAWREALEHVTLEFLRLDTALRTLQAEKDELEAAHSKTAGEERVRSRSNSRRRDSEDDTSTSVSLSPDGGAIGNGDSRVRADTRSQEEVAKFAGGGERAGSKPKVLAKTHVPGVMHRVVSPRTVDLDLRMFGEDLARSPANAHLSPDIPVLDRSSYSGGSGSSTSAALMRSNMKASGSPHAAAKRIRTPGTPRLESVHSGTPMPSPKNGAVRKQPSVRISGLMAKQLSYRVKHVFGSAGTPSNAPDAAEASIGISAGGNSAEDEVSVMEGRFSHRSLPSNDPLPLSRRTSLRRENPSEEDVLYQASNQRLSGCSVASRGTTRAGTKTRYDSAASSGTPAHKELNFGSSYALVDASSGIVPRPRPSEFSSITGDTFNLLSVELLKCWVRDEDGRRFPRKWSRKALSAETRALDSDNEDVKQSSWKHRFQKRIIINPSSTYSLLWEAIGAIVIFWDIFMLPLDVFDPGRTTLLEVTEQVARLFWTASIPRSFVLGYMRPDGDFEMNIDKVMRHYLTGWFMFDFTVIVIDWYTYIIEGMQVLSAMRIARFGRFLRLLRVIRVARMFKSSSSLGALSEYLHLEKVTVIMNILKVTIAFTVGVHISACIWYGLTRLHDDEWTWAKEAGIDNEPLGARYAISAHWAVTQFIGTMEVFPQNTSERCYSVCLLVVNFILTAAFVSRVTAAMTQLHFLTEGRHQQLMVLRQFLNNHRISKKLTLRVIRSARTAQALQGKNILEKDIDLLRHISRPLAAEVHNELYAAKLVQHPFFRFSQTSNNAMMRKFCHQATENMAIQAGDVIFTAGEAPKVPRMFFVQKGSLHYASHNVETTLKPPMWASEAVLWIHWFHVGELVAVEDSQLLGLQSEAFQAVVMEFRGDTGFVFNYAEAYARLVNEDVGDFADATSEDMDRAEACVTLAHRTARQKSR